MIKSEQAFLNNDNTPDVIIPQEVGPGTRLKAIRENLGYSAEYVADNLRLKHHVIHALEDEKYEQLGSHVFIRGYIRAYAMMMGVTQAEMQSLLTQFNQLGLTDAQSTPVSLHPRPRKSSNIVETILQSISYLVFLGIAILVGTWWYTHQTADVIAIEKSTDLDAPNVIRAEADRSERLVLPKSSNETSADSDDSDILLPEQYAQPNSMSPAAEKNAVRSHDLVSDHPDVPVAPIVPMNVSPSDAAIGATSDGSEQASSATKDTSPVAKKPDFVSATNSSLNQKSYQRKNRNKSAALSAHNDSARSKQDSREISSTKTDARNSSGAVPNASSSANWREPASGQTRSSDKPRYSPF